MKTKKYEGATEQEILERIRDELGLSAIIISIKKKKRRGLCAFFRKPTIVITAAYEEGEVERDKLLSAAAAAVSDKKQNGQAEENPGDILLGDFGKNIPHNFSDLQAQGLQAQVSPYDPSGQVLPYDPAAVLPGAVSPNPPNPPNPMESKVIETEAKLAEALARLSAAERAASAVPGHKYENDKLRILFDSLVGQGVLPEIAEKILAEAATLGTDDINLLLKIVYNTIVEILGEPRMLVGKTKSEHHPNIVVFMGSTGVGKTTTIAKLSSILLLNLHLRVGLITADTYRIAAVEQLKTYADILDLNLGVVYSGDEIVSNVEKLAKVSDIILIDTAGRSHHNAENLNELTNMLTLIPTSHKYLVLSATTRQEDLISVVNTYSGITDFDLIFTKLDETSSLGVILNTCFLTGKKIAYVTFGQNVPEDIGEIQPDKIAKTLMGHGLKDSGPVWGAS